MKTAPINISEHIRQKWLSSECRQKKKNGK